MFLPRDATHSAVLLRQSRLSVCPSVTRYRHHIGCNSSEIISLLATLGCSLFADPNNADLLQGKHTAILAGIGMGYRKSGFRRTNYYYHCYHLCGEIKILKSFNISESQQDRSRRLLVRINSKSYTRFRLVQKSTEIR